MAEGSVEDPVEIELSDGRGARVGIAPARGGIVARFDVGDERVLFLDEATLADPSKNVRGGIPVLFPSPGKLTGDRWACRGRAGELKQHGFARDLAWDVVSAGPRSATLRLSTSDATRALWPWDFVLELRYTLDGATLRSEQRVENRGGDPMPFGLGFHPYFHVAQADKAGVVIPTAATRAFDNTTKRVVPLGGSASKIDLTHSEVDLHLVDHGRSSAELRWPGGREVRLRASPEYGQWVVWTLVDRDFVCVEPWTCPGDALNTGERLMLLDPGQARGFFLEVELHAGVR